jgi:predicted transcriptional regulator
MSGATSISIPAELMSRLERVAKETNQDLAVLVTEALENLVQTEEEELAGIERAEEDIKGGRVVAHERVVEWLKSWGSGRKVPPPLCK